MSVAAPYENSNRAGAHARDEARNDRRGEVVLRMIGGVEHIRVGPRVRDRERRPQADGPSVNRHRFDGFGQLGLRRDGRGEETDTGHEDTSQGGASAVGCRHERGFNRVMPS